MKITFDMEQLTPGFILNDYNGRALAKAIQAAMEYTAKAAEAGIDTIMNPDKMPEWRLDELAGELNILYSYEAAVNVKREWIKNAYNNYRIYGTAEGILQYLKIYFDECSIQEFWEYDGDPFKFNVVVSGTRTDENEAWVRKAVGKAKNVRSELDNIVFNGGSAGTDTVRAGTGASGIEVNDYVRMLPDTQQLLVGDIQEMDVGILQQKDVRRIQGGT